MFKIGARSLIFPVELLSIDFLLLSTDVNSELILLQAPPAVVLLVLLERLIELHLADLVVWCRYFRKFSVYDKRGCMK